MIEGAPGLAARDPLCLENDKSRPEKGWGAEARISATPIARARHNHRNP